MPQKYRTPFTKTLFDTTIDDILTPEDLVEYVVLGANVRRYKFQDDDFDHIFDDHVDEHTKRMVLYAEHLPFQMTIRQHLSAPSGSMISRKSSILRRASRI